MKNLCIALLLIVGFTANAQTGFNHITLKGGATLESGFNFEVGYEINKKYFTNWSIFFSGFYQEKNLEEGINNWTTGIYYEPILIASKNNLLNLKIGSSAGTNENQFIFDAILGVEYNRAITDKVQFSVFFKNNLMFNSEVRFRHALLIGFKHRL